MINDTINLKDIYKNLKYDCILESYCPSNFDEIDINRIRKTILVLPGGAYKYTSRRESEPIALKFMSFDYNCFVLNYNCVNKIERLEYPYPMIEAYAAIDFIRKNARKYNVDTNNIIVMGFSAGGHLAASVSNYYDDIKFSDYLDTDIVNLKVNACILCYPVIKMDKDTHIETKLNITHNDKELIKYYSLDKSVRNIFPKTFIWATREDEAVPVINSIELSKRLSELNIYNELVLYDHGWHGLSLADKSVYGNLSDEKLEYIKEVRGWVKKAREFIEKL